MTALFKNGFKGVRMVAIDEDGSALIPNSNFLSSVIRKGKMKDPQVNSWQAFQDTVVARWLAIGHGTVE